MLVVSKSQTFGDCNLTWSLTLYDMISTECFWLGRLVSHLLDKTVSQKRDDWLVGRSLGLGLPTSEPDLLDTCWHLAALCEAEQMSCQVTRLKSETGTSRWTNVVHTGRIGARGATIRGQENGALLFVTPRTVHDEQYFQFERSEVRLVTFLAPPSLRVSQLDLRTIVSYFLLGYSPILQLIKRQLCSLVYLVCPQYARVDYSINLYFMLIQPTCFISYPIHLFSQGTDLSFPEFSVAYRWVP